MSGTLTFPLDCFVGLAVAGAEVTAPGYVRQAATLATTVDGDAVANTETLQWSHATQPWGVVDTVLIYDAVAGGARLGSLPPLVPLEIRQYDSARIPAGGLVAVQATIPRGYGTGRWGTYGFGIASALTSGAADFDAGDFDSGDFATGSGLTVNLERTFDAQHTCSPGTWAPGPFSMAA